MSTSTSLTPFLPMSAPAALPTPNPPRSEEHTSELQSQSNLVCRLLLEKKKTKTKLLTEDLRTTTTSPAPLLWPCGLPSRVVIAVAPCARTRRSLTFCCTLPHGPTCASM